MRFRSFVLGSLTLLLTAFVLSSGVAPGRKPDKGFNPGEEFPIVEMEGFVEGTASGTHPLREGEVLVVTWSVRDAYSRIANAWLTHHADGLPLYSVCLDVTKSDAELYARMDNVASGTPILSAEEMGRGLRHSLTERGPRIYRLSQGLVEQVFHPGDLRVRMSGVADEATTAAPAV